MPDNSMTIKDLIKKLGWKPLQVGTIIKMRDGRKLLVGDINPLGGVCDDCVEHGEIDEEESM